MASSTTTNRAQELLRACSAGDVNQAADLFSIMGISGPQDPVPFVYGQEPSSLGSDGPPSTYHMLEAASQFHPALPLLSLLLDTFPQASIQPGHLESLVEHGDLDALRLLLEHDASALNDELDESGRTLLGNAVASSAEAAMLLLDFGADPNAVDFFRRSLLEASMDRERLNYEPSVELVEALLANGAVLHEGAVTRATGLPEQFAKAIVLSMPNITIVTAGLQAAGSRRNSEAAQLFMDYIKTKAPA